MSCLLEEKLALSNEDLIKIIGTYSLAAVYNLSKTQLLSKNSFVNREELADEILLSCFGMPLHKVAAMMQEAGL